MNKPAKLLLFALNIIAWIISLALADLSNSDTFAVIVMLIASLFFVLFVNIVFFGLYFLARKPRYNKK